MFYTIHSDVERNHLRIHDISLSIGGKELEDYIMTEGMTKTLQNNRAFSGMLEYYFEHPVESTSFQVDVEVTGSPSDYQMDTAFHETFTVPFELQKDLLAKKSYELNETVLVEDQEIMIKEVTIYPLRVAVHMQMNPQNTKKILCFKDLQLIDETGETWGSVQNGITAEMLTDHEQIVYLQSNYFRNPKELYLEVNQIQAIDQEESVVIVDLEAEEIIQQPEENYLRSVEMDGRYLIFQTDINLMEQPINFSEILNEENEVLQSTAAYYQRQELGIRIDDYDQQMGLLFLELSDYPLWINSDVKIRIK